MNKITLLLLCIILHGCKQRTTNDRPNIVWIVSEDNSAHFMNLYASNGVATPNIEKLANKGILFENAYSMAPVCSAARSAIISGCNNVRTGTQFHRASQDVPLPHGVEFYSKLLQDAGYYTANNSKEDYNYKTTDKGWNESSRKASYRNRKEGQPFFQVWNFGTTHESCLHFDPKEVTTKPTNINPDTITVFPYHPNTKLFRYTYARYYDQIQKMDKQVGEKVKQLKEDGLLSNTIIFYYGDNGGILPRSKGYAYDNGTKVPMVVYLPKKYQHLFPTELPNRSKAMVNFTDLAPTLLSITGCKIPNELDGKPFLGKSVTKEDLNSRDEVFSFADRFDEKSDMVRTIRIGNYEYIRSYQPFYIDGQYNMYRYKQATYREWYNLYRDGELTAQQSAFFKDRPAEMLFDLSKDPHEIKNLSSDPHYRDILSKMRSKMIQKEQDLNDLSFFPESYLQKVAFSDPSSFGIKHKKEINELMDIANLELLSFDEAKESIVANLNASNPWKRYWALIVCSSFGRQAEELLPVIQTIASQDDERLVRVRAIEYLGLLGDKKVIKDITDEVNQSKNVMEIVEILNSASMIKMHQPNFNFHINPNLISPDWDKKETVWVKNLVSYLNGEGLII
ncbi:sulfatase-like hydrolase/transferase [Halosquirtibacter xylanolyticus]|uniref:sulfatase-like hydrolase/transferase n=1 Tax=Halosquirtibacter xylanolyticus TaxID=3374599 RepID=UPI0037478B36|nr:sulfatase-like hydrolase/transferase [Prolixibacteraceae bacterium]